MLVASPKPLIQIKPIWHSIVMMIVLSGCTPSPHDPALNVAYPHTMRNGTQLINSKNAQDFSRDRWWKKMHDPLLNHLMREALAHNNQLQVAHATILQAQASLKQAHFAWLPTASATGNGFIGGGWDSHVTPQGALAASPVLTKLGNIHFRGYYSGFMPSYSLNILANINHDKAARASLAMQQATYRSTQLSIVSQVAGAYFMLLGQKAQAHEQTRLIHDLQQVRHLERIRFKQGASDRLTLTTLDEQLTNEQAHLVSLENSTAQVENALQVLINRNPGPIKTHQTLVDLPAEGLIPKHLPSAVLNNRPDLMIASDQLAIADANRGLAYANFFPNLSLTGLLGGASVDLSHLLTLSTNLWVAEAAASMTLLNGAAYEQIKASKAGYTAAFYQYLQTLRSVFADVDNSLTNHQKMTKMHHYQVCALRQANQRYLLAKARYETGANDKRNMLNEKVNLDKSKINLILSKMQQLDSLVEVYQALAAGSDAT